MFKISNIKINKDIISITNRHKKTYNVNINNDQFLELISLASNRSKSIGNNIAYIKKIGSISLWLTLICAALAVSPLLLGAFYAEVPLLFFGCIGVGTIGLNIATKIYTKWLKKYSISNEYWEQIYNELSSNQNVIDKSKKNSIDLSHFQDYNFNKSYGDKNKSNNKEKIIQDNCTYGYKKNQIIQDDLAKDKVKTYKRY